MKKILLIFVILVLVIAGLTLAKNIIARAAIINGVKAMTGLELEIGKVNVGVLNTFLDLGGLKVLNSSAFSDKVLADFPQIYANYSLGDFFKGKAHFKELKIDLKELTVVRNREGAVNVNSLKALMPKGGGKPPQVQIDKLDLRVGKVFYKDYSSGTPQTREFNVGINEQIDNVTDPNALVRLILLRALSRTNIGSLADIDLSGLKDEVTKKVSQEAQVAVETTKEKAAEAIDKIGKEVEGLFR